MLDAVAEGIAGRSEYSGLEAVWCALEGGHVTIEIHGSYERPKVLLTPPQAVALGELLAELAARACEVVRVTD